MQSLRTLKHIIVPLSFLTTLPSYANEQKLNDINALIQQQLPHAAVGLMVQDPHSGDILYQYRAQENFYPASNIKLFMAAAALKFFGPEFQFQTSLHADKTKIANHTLAGNLYIVFRGDPSFTSNDLMQLFADFKAKGIHKINGNIIIDDTAFKAPAYANGWTWESVPWYFSAPVTTIILNENKVQLKFDKPGKLYDMIAVSQTDNVIPKLKLNTQITAVTVDEAKNNCQLNATVKNNDIQLEGCWPFEKTPFNVRCAIDSPRKLAQQLIKNDLQQQGIKLSGKIEFGKLPKDLPMIIVKRSEPLKSLLKKVLGDSNNIYTESLTKALGIAYYQQGTFQAGVSAMKKILQEDAGLDFSQARIEDGSGQSRYNLASPQLFTALLRHMMRDKYFNDYYAALSSSGQSGTLEGRMKETLPGKVVAKTGGAYGTSTLSGYITTQSGKPLIFSLMINQTTADYATVKRLEDKICEMIAQDAL